MNILPNVQDLWAVDFETTGLNLHQDDKIVSMAVSYFKDGQLTSKFLDTEEQISKLLTFLSDTQKPVLAYNVQFEMLCVMTQYPNLNINWVADALRLVQQEFTPREKSFSLKVATQKLLPQYANYESEIKEWVKNNVVGENGKKPNDKTWGKYIIQAPKDILARYNTADTENTFRLWAIILKRWEKEGFYGPNKELVAFDHVRYIKRCKRFVKAKIKGFSVEREALKNTQKDVKEKLSTFESKFLEQHQEDIDKVLDIRWDLELAKKRDNCKTEKGKAKHTREASPDSRPTFNINSNQQLRMLFVDVQGQVPRIFTETKQPSFNKNHLNQFKGTELLIEKSQYVQADKQVDKLLEITEYNSTYHPDVRAAGTVTGRTAGGGGFNLQAIHRGFEPLTGNIKARPGHVFVGSDIESAEPSITAQFSGDPLVRYFAFEGEGKKPFYKDGIFFCDDPYVSLAAMTPMGRDTIRKVYEEGVDGQDFGDFWINNAEPGKILFKKVRKMHKPWYLGLGYGMGPKKLKEGSDEAGMPISFKDAKDIYMAYWNMIPYVRRFAEKCSNLVEKQGYINNVFGFHMRPDSHNGFNAIIQSSVNTVMDLFCEYIEDNGFADAFRCLIHDEALFEVKIEDLPRFLEVKEQAQKYVQDFLQWDVPMRFGAAIGTTFYEAKEGLSDDKLRELGIIP